MKLVEQRKTLKTNADFVSQDFSIGDVSVVIEILRNKLYRHKVRTLVQEYISNGRDAMRETGSKGQIDITLPTMFSPTFKVRDYGLGITPDRMNNVFIKYASSTKRKDNVQTGGFGIGAKSAWSYTESFTIVTFIDGIQRSYVAHIGANNNGRLDFLGETDTNAPNGTEIQIPVNPRDVTEFCRAAYRATFFWKQEEKPNFINAKDKVEYNPGEFLDCLEINNNLPSFIAPEYETGVVISIDGIPYYADGSMIEKVKSLQKLTKLVEGKIVLHIENGQLEVSASREEISDSKFTLANLESIAAEAFTAVDKEIKAAFKDATTPFDHLSVYMKLKDIYNLEAYRKCGDFTVSDDEAIGSDLFGGTKIEVCTLLTDKDNNERVNKQPLNRRGRSWRYTKPTISAELFDSLYFVDTAESAVITNYRVRSLLKKTDKVIIFSKYTDTDKNNIKSNYVIPSCTLDALKKGLGLKDITTIAYTKPERKTREVIKEERTKQQFCIHKFDNYGRNTSFVTLAGNGQEWLFVEKTNKLDRDSLRSLSNYLEETLGYKICALSKDAMRRVKGDANFQPLADFLKSYKVTKQDITNLKRELAVNPVIMSDLTRVKGLTDAFLIKMVDEYKSHAKLTGSVPDMIRALVLKEQEVIDFKKDDKLLSDEIKTRYPLLTSIHWSDKIRDEVAFYINSK